MNDELIKSVFAKMVEYRPALGKYLVSDEEEDDDDEVDTRILGDLIIKNFPWPIGVELRRLFSGSMRQLDRARLDQLFKTIERTMQFLSFVLVAQLWEEQRKNKLQLSEEIRSQFGNRFSTLTLGNYAWIIRSICKVFLENDTPHFIAETQEIFTSKFFNQLDFWVPERNEIGHYQINLTQGETERRCVEYQDRLQNILTSLAFFVRYKLVTVRQIDVKKQKHREARFNHHFDLLNSSDSDFKGAEVEHNVFVDSNAVLLLKDFKAPSEYLNLSPLVIDTRTEVIDTKDKFNIKKDIFLYTKFSNNKISYVGTEVTVKCDLSLLSSYNVLMAEYAEMMKDILEPAAVA